MLMRRLTWIVLMAAINLTAKAQSEGALVLGVETEKKFTKQLTIGLEADMRSRNDFKTMDRWSIGVGADYKLASWLKMDVGYSLLSSNFREKITYKSSGAYNKWRPSYWGYRYRFHASLTGFYRFSNNIRLSLRERWQYTWRPEQMVSRWDFDDAQWKEKLRSGTGKNQLRSRLLVTLDKKKLLLRPYLSVELYNNWGLEKVRYTLGTDIKLGKNQMLDVFYRYQNQRQVDDSDYDPDMHYIGICYKLKL